MDNISVLHCISSLHRKLGGASVVVSQCTDALAEHCHLDISLLSQAVPESQELEPSGSSVSRIFSDEGGAFSHVCGFAFRRKLKNFLETSGADIVHSHGLWLPVNHWASTLAAQYGIPTVIQPHGALEPWAMKRSKWKKALAMHAFLGADLRRAKALIATSDSEFEGIRKAGLKAPVAVIPNGLKVDDVKVISRSGPPERQRVLLFLSRIHPVKGLLNLINAWAQIDRRNWRLIIAGPEEVGHLQEVCSLVRSLGVEGSVEYVGAVHGASKSALFAVADVFVLPSFSENFGLVVAEALAEGLPVIASKAAPWKDLVVHRCGWWVDVGVLPLVKALEESISISDEDRQAMGCRGRELVKKFSWKRIAQDTRDVYQWLLGKGDKPSVVRTD